MSNRLTGEDWFEKLAAEADGPDLTAPSKLKARAYSAIIGEQQQSGSLLDLSSSRQDGKQLCVFEQLVQIAPVGQSAKSVFYCNVCHARLLAEHLENAPIYWPHCPYVRFQNR